jgi:hypothetical protein
MLGRGHQPRPEAIRRAGLFNEDGDYATPSAASSW